MCGQLESGIIEQVSESPEPPDRDYPIILVRKDKTTSKVRVVYDASCDTEGAGPSPNQCLHVGPSFGQPILDILVRFKIHRPLL